MLLRKKWLIGYNIFFNIWELDLIEIFIGEAIIYENSY